MFVMFRCRDITYQGRRKEILTYTAMAKWLKPYRLMQKLNDYKREYCVQNTHAYKACQHCRSGDMMPQKILRNFDLINLYVALLPQKLYIIATSVIPYNGNHPRKKTFANYLLCHSPRENFRDSVNLIYKHSGRDKKCKKTFMNASRFAKFAKLFFRG